MLNSAKNMVEAAYEINLTNEYMKKNQNTLSGL